MPKRFVSIWFRHLTTDWLALRRPELKGMPFIFILPDHGRMMVTAVSAAAEAMGIEPGMRAADAKAIVPGLEVVDDDPARPAKLLKGIGEWCIRYSPTVAVELPDGLVMEVSGCAHLWGGEYEYLKKIVSSLKDKGYLVRTAMADTIGTAWAISRYGQITPIIAPGEQAQALMPLPPAALRLQPDLVDSLRTLGFHQIKAFIGMTRSALRRRFKEHFLLRLAQALGDEEEYIIPLEQPVAYIERLPCIEPVPHRKGIEIAIRNLLDALCLRLSDEGKGIRTALLKCYRLDGRVVTAEIGTNRPSHSTTHLYKLLELKISDLKPGLGIELFTLEASKVEDMPKVQDALWKGKPGLDDQNIAELIDRLAGKIGPGKIHRYLPQEHYWPERSIKSAFLHEKKVTKYRKKPRPTQLLPKPEAIDVSAPVPDYPPMLFRYQNKVHHIKKADGPERIEREWWIEAGKHRDYYYVEDEEGQRYWLYREGHYEGNKPHQWFIHGFFA